MAKTYVGIAAAEFLSCCDGERDVDGFVIQIYKRLCDPVFLIERVCPDSGMPYPADRSDDVVEVTDNDDGKIAIVLKTDCFASYAYRRDRPVQDEDLEAAQMINIQNCTVPGVPDRWPDSGLLMISGIPIPGAEPVEVNFQEGYIKTEAYRCLDGDYMQCLLQNLHENPRYGRGQTVGTVWMKSL